MILLTLLILSFLKLCLLKPKTTKMEEQVYQFKLDTLRKVWHRQYISVIAGSEKEAIEKAIKLAKEEDEFGYIEEDADYGEYLLEAGIEQVTVEENEGNPTVELEYDNQVIWSNTQIKA